MHIAQVITECDGLASPFTVFMTHGNANRAIIAVPYLTSNIVALTPSLHNGAIPGAA